MITTIKQAFWFVLLTVSVFCSFARADPFALTVVHGSGSGTYNASSQVHIFADPYEDPNASVRESAEVAAPVRIFDRWIGDTGAVADVLSPDTIITMPQSSITVTAQYKDAPRWSLPTVWTYFPPNHDKVIFVFHGGLGGSAANLMTNVEMSRFVDAAAARGYGIVALDSYNRSQELQDTWDGNLSATDNIDMQRVVALRNELIGKGAMRASDPIYLFGVSGGGVFASQFDQFAQQDLGFQVKATALMVSPGNSQVLLSSTVPTIFLLAENDTSVAGINDLAVENSNFLISRNVPTQLWVNPPSPVYPERFWRINHLSRADSKTIYNAIKSGGYLDDKGFLLSNPKNSNWQTVIPSQYSSYISAISEQLQVAYAEHVANSAFSEKILDFFANPETTIPPVPPVISDFTPASGTAGTTVTINGSSFINVTKVKFNGIEATFQQISTTKLVAVVPQGASSGSIQVSSSAGTATSSTAFAIKGPVINSFSPVAGVIGTAVTISGDNFVGVREVRFNGVSATFTVTAPSTQLRVTVPTGALSGTIKVVTDGGSVVSATSFTVLVPAVISGFTPTKGPVGTVVKVTGQNFTGATAVTVSGVTAKFTVVSDTEISVTVPAGCARLGKIRVTTPAGTTTSAASFTLTTS